MKTNYVIECRHSPDGIFRLEDYGPVASWQIIWEWRICFSFPTARDRDTYLVELRDRIRTRWLEYRAADYDN